MSQSNRRTFLGQIGSAAIVIPELRNLPFRAAADPSSASASPQAAAQSPGAAASAAYDLLIAGGRVVDPSQKLSAERDVAITAGNYLADDQWIPPTRVLREVILESIL